MFADILEQSTLEHLFSTYKKEGKSSAGAIIIDIVNRLITRKNETLLNLTVDTTVINICKLNSQKKKLKKGYFEIINFYEQLKERGMERINVADVQISKIRDSLAEEIRGIKERETAILEVIASWGSIILSIIAIIISIIALCS
ncbi:MAG: hypothetical protein GOP50_02670 [Candidatus Heimdallarchaeota archaeon]|nr:hypothetical protein [Candidatus Heimdallarchaeota archaeon]